MLLRVESQGLLTVGYSELSSKRSILRETGNELYRSLSSRRRAAGTLVLIMLCCLRVDYSVRRMSFHVTYVYCIP